MQYLDNDIDDLFQRAADGYPLKKTAGDWDAVASSLPPAERKKRAFAWLFNWKTVGGGILVAALLFSGTFWLYQSQPVSYPVPADQASHSPKSEPGDSKVNNSEPVFQDRNSATISQAENRGLDPKDAEATSRSYYSKKRLQRQSKNETLKALPVASFDNLSINTNETGNIDVNHLSNLHNSDLSKTINSGDKLLPIRIDPLNESFRLPRSRRFYLGVAAGPDLNWVGDRKNAGVGLDVGFIAGMKISRRLAVETGLYLNRKKYASAGSDFNADKMGNTMPSGMSIATLTSSSDVLKIPLRLRYDVSQRRKSTMYIFGGAAAAIYLQERNVYHVQFNGSPQLMKGVYRDNMTSFPAVAEAGIGYQKRISGNTQIRIEPYVALPLTGMGIGSLHVSGAGVHVGLTKNF